MAIIFDSTQSKNQKYRIKSAIFGARGSGVQTTLVTRFIKRKFYDDLESSVYSLFNVTSCEFFGMMCVG